MKVKRLAPLMLLITAMIWGSGFVATQAAIDANLSASFIMLGRFTIAALAFGLVFHKRLRGFTGKEIGMSLAAGLLLFLSFIVQTSALRYTTPSKNAFLTATNVVMVPFLLWILSRKRPDARAFISAVICFGGVCVLSVDFSRGMHFCLGDTLSLLCALIFALHMVVLADFVKRVDAVKITFGQLFGAALFALLVFLAADRDLSALRPSTGLLAVAYLGLFSTCVCYFLQTFAQQYVSATRTSLILSTESVFGTMFSVLLGYESLKVTMFLGGLMILGSIVFVEMKHKTR